jgi:fyn-related kinase
MGTCIGKSKKELKYAQNESFTQEIKQNTKLETLSLPVTSSINNLFVALFDYEARTDNDLSFKKYDLLQIHKKEGTWWLAEQVNPKEDEKKKGYIPSEYVAKYKSLESESWFFGQINRREAEQLLSTDVNKPGSFLVRISEGANPYSLSMRDLNDSIKHYRIRKTEDNDALFYIARRITFKTLQDLVDYYSQNADGLWSQLLYPCVKLNRPTTDGLNYKLKDEYEVDRSRFRLIQKCGQGQFGDVYEGLFDNKLKVAIKMLKPSTTMNAQDFLKEASLMKKLKHPRLMQLYAMCTEKEPFYIVTEFMKNGNLLEFLQTPKGKRVNFEILINMASQIADGMSYLESKQFIHRDLAARNILVEETLDIKIGDFGLARFIYQNNGEYLLGANENTKFPIKWTAIEAALYNKFTTKSDVWSFGVLLTELITYGRVPYPGMTNKQVLESIIDNGYRMPQPSNCPNKLYDIMLRCWLENPDDRPTFATLKDILDNFFDNDSENQYVSNS